MRMRMTAMLIIATAACATAKPLTMSGAIPNGRQAALECVLDQAVDLGYSAIEGGVSDGRMRLRKMYDYTASDAGKETAARVMTLGMGGNNRLEADHVVVTAGATTMRFEIVGERENGFGKPGDRGQSDARIMMDACGGEVGDSQR